MFDTISYPVGSEFINDVPKNSFPRTCCKHRVLLARESAQGLKFVRFPLIQSKELHCFQHLKTLP
jgi:hypothetical protein